MVISDNFFSGENCETLYLLADNAIYHNILLHDDIIYLYIIKIILLSYL